MQSRLYRLGANGLAVVRCVFFGTAIGTAVLCQAADAPSATPYRPTVSNPAELSEPGWLEAELGGLRARGGDDGRRDSVPYLVKFAFSRDWGVLLGGDAHVAVIDGGRLSGAGDTSLTLKHRIGVDDVSAFGIEAGAKAPTAKSGLGSGKSDYTLNGIYSRDIGDYRIDLNFNVTRLGAVGMVEGHSQRGWAASLSRGLNERWSLAGELSGTTRRGVSDTAQFLVATSYNSSKRVAWDAGAAFGLTRATPDWSIFAGVTVLIGQLR